MANCTNGDHYQRPVGGPRKCWGMKVQTEVWLKVRVPRPR
jgi:hypothetical protein